MKYKWAIIDSKGNIIEKFRYKETAKQTLPHYKLHKKEPLEIIKLEEENEKRIIKRKD